ncbi:conserved exported protein of unknown function [Thauera humireducens]|uniref:hypothetical protein n=1 Tax=Thauera humireducens TaxID=1134435 RepID=UPI0024679FC7|nr:hypothetical protein [Thauera humireducens]CAH1747699.1 conserved exported protein of unknown function [Thauera humireducens]
MTKIAVTALVTALSTLAGCASITPTQTTESAYLVLDVKASPNDRNALLNDVTNAVKTHMSSARVNRGIPPATLPEKPTQFRLTNPFAGSSLGALAAASGTSTQVPVCDDSLLTISAADTGGMQYGESTSFFTCVVQYREGFQVNVYATFSEVTGGLTPQVIGATLAKQMVGGRSQFIPRAMNDVRTAVGRYGEVAIVDSYIPDSFRGAFVDSVSTVSKN